MTTPLPDSSEAWISPLFDAMVSEIQLSGYFDKVNTHEPKRKPGRGLTAAVWLQTLEPVGLVSGLDKSSALAVFIARFYILMQKEPQDYIDPSLMMASSNVMRRFHDNFDFNLDPMVRNVDVFGQCGTVMRLQAGYVEQDNAMFRVMDLTVPVILNDVWPQNK